MFTNDTLALTILILVGIPLLATFGALIGGAILSAFGLAASAISLLVICTTVFITPAPSRSAWVLMVMAAPALGWITAIILGRRNPR